MRLPLIRMGSGFVTIALFAGAPAVAVEADVLPPFTADAMAQAASPQAIAEYRRKLREYEQVRAAFEGHTSYFGTFTIDPSARTVTHHVRGASYPNWMGHDHIRYYRIDGSHLVLSSPPILFQGESLEYILTWERI